MKAPMEPQPAPKHHAFNQPVFMPRYSNLSQVLAALSIAWRNLMADDTTGTNSSRALEVDQEMGRILEMMREISMIRVISTGLSDLEKANKSR